MRARSSRPFCPCNGRRMRLWDLAAGCRYTAHIMERPRSLLVSRGRMTTTWARLPEVVATGGDDLGLWQVCGGGDPGAGVGSVLTWTAHRGALLAQRFGPELYAKRLRGATRCSRYSLLF